MSDWSTIEIEQVHLRRADDRSPEARYYPPEASLDEDLDAPPVPSAEVEIDLRGTGDHGVRKRVILLSHARVSVFKSSALVPAGSGLVVPHDEAESLVADGWARWA